MPGPRTAKSRPVAFSSKPKPKFSGGVLGRLGWEKICAVEGITLREETRRMFEEFDRLGLPPEERIRRIIAKHSKAKRPRR